MSVHDRTRGGRYIGDSNTLVVTRLVQDYTVSHNSVFAYQVISVSDFKESFYYEHCYVITHI